MIRFAEGDLVVVAREGFDDGIGVWVDAMRKIVGKKAIISFIDRQDDTIEIKIINSGAKFWVPRLCLDHA